MATDKTPSEDYLGFVEIFRGVRPDIETGSMFGMRCMKRGGKAFAGGFAGGLVVKSAAPAWISALCFPATRGIVRITSRWSSRTTG